MKKFVKLFSVCFITLSVFLVSSCNSYGNDVAAAFKMEQEEDGATMTEEMVFKTDNTLEVNLKVKMGLISAKGEGTGTYTVATGDVSGDSTGTFTIDAITLSFFGVEIDSIEGSSGPFVTTSEGLYMGEEVTDDSECMPRVK
ncbi:MAG: hypothetical protein K5866_01080 [Treponema sp.]|nr:hypothetical protein [Treponema sp.]